MIIISHWLSYTELKYFKLDLKFKFYEPKIHKYYVPMIT